MKKAIILFLFTVLLLALFDCKKKEASNDSKYAEYISEYTSGIISKKSSIRLSLVNSVDLSDPKISVNNRVPDSIFTVSPKINGRIQWLDDRTIIVYPDKDLVSGKEYHAELKLKELFNVSRDLEVFSFNFTIMRQNFDVAQDEISLYEKNKAGYQKISGIIETADSAEAGDVEKILKINYNRSRVITQWDHNYGTNKHKFTISELMRDEKTYKINLEFNGTYIGVSGNKKLEYEIYGLKDFSYLNFAIIQSPEQFLDMRFSMLLNERQDLKGIVEVTGDDNPKFLIEKNILRYYPSSSRKNSVTIKVSKMLKDITDNTLGNDVEFSAAFSLENPHVRWVNKKGGILPSTDGLLLSFEAITLKAVDITVIEIYENNMVQFLQVNSNLTGTYEIKRVGRPVLYKTIDLDKTAVKNLYEWNRYNINLSDVVNMKPGSLYQVRVNFRMSHSLYKNDDNTSDVLEEDPFYKENFDAESRGRNFDDYYYYYDDYYNDDWENRDNPLKPAYYGKRREITMNILASDLGIVAKGSRTGELKVFVSDITTTQPISGADVEAYNYQNQVLGSAKTDSTGFVSLNLEGVPFVVAVKKGKQRGYLKTDDGSSLSVSNFDVGGTSSTNGIKGFIYGERGVWRPGDTVYLYFILEDKKKILPADHPVIFELRDPNGQLEKKIVKKDNVNGIYDFTFNTSDDDLTGNWDANIRVGKDIFNKKIKIETIKPNRLKVDLKFETDALRIIDGYAKADLEVKWLHGSPGKNLKTEYEIGYLPMKTSFKNYFAYNFDDPSKTFSSAKESVFSGYTDENGKASFDMNLVEQNGCSGMLKAVFMGKVFEEGGDFSIDNFEMSYYPYSGYAGIKMPEVDKTRSMYLEDSEYKVEIVSVDSYGKPVPGKNLNVEIYRMSWRWWWDRNDSEWENYVSNMYQNKILSDTLNTDKNGKGTYTLKIKNDWGRFLLKVTDPASGHSAANLFYVYWSGWGTNKQKDELGAATMLSVYSDKEQYMVGENALITIPSSSDGRALVSIENGSGVVDSFWVETRQGKTEFKFKVTSKMAPNVYVNTTLIQPHAQVKNDLPVRLYGIVPIKIVDPQTKLEPVLNVPGTMEPEKQFDITVAEKTGKPMAYTIAVVDEGLLDITNFKTPNPWDSFYSKEALGVNTWDVYEDVIGAMTKVFGPILSIGGDETVKPPSAQKANRFKPVVKCFGPFYLGGGEIKKHSFLMPRYVGSVRTMIVAADNGAYGNAEKSTLVKNDLMVLGTMPRVMGPGETVSLPVNVFVLNDRIKNVTVSIKTEGTLTVNGESTKQAAFEKSGDKFVYFNLMVKDAIGIGKVSIIASSGQNKATYEVELDSRIATPIITEVRDALLNPGEKKTFQASLIGLAGTNKQTVEISYLPPVNLTKRLEYLIRYPHGCIEQTTSAAFPQLFLQDITQLSPAQKNDIEIHIRAAIEKMKAFRMTTGAFSYWPGSFDVSDWGTSYAGHFLLEAKDKGYPVPDNLINDWISYQTDLANKWNYERNGWYDHAQAYRLYTLALANRPALGAMNRLKDISLLDPIAKWRLAAAYVLAGKKDAAQDIISNTMLKYSDYTYDYYTYGSELRDKAMALETLVLLGKKEDGFKLLKEISERLGQEYWCSTQTTAYCLVAISKFGMTSNGSPISCKYSFGQESGIVTGNKPIITKDIKPGTGSFVIENNGKQAVYAKLISRGNPVKDLEKESESVIKMAINYFDGEGGQITDISKIKQGSDIIIKASVYNNGTYGTVENLALTQIFPSGWEIINTRLNDSQGLDNSSTADYRDIRDDRVMTYFKLRSGETKTFNVTVNASYLGKFYASGANCEAMYNDRVFARKAGKDITIEK